MMTKTLLAVSLALFMAGCGYEFGTTVKPGSARGLRLAVPVFLNDTFEPILDKRLTDQIRRQFLQADGLTLVNDVESAPAVLRGKIQGYTIQTISFRNGGVNEQRVTLRAEVQVEDPATRKVFWKETYTSSAEFFQTNDLAQTRSRQDRATDEACQSMAENIVSRVLEGYEPGK
jgi:outer membrane lipopolysaccharide assembly protein LptE/RlpB